MVKNLVIFWNRYSDEEGGGGRKTSLVFHFVDHFTKYVSSTSFNIIPTSWSSGGVCQGSPKRFEGFNRGGEPKLFVRKHVGERKEEERWGILQKRGRFYRP